MTTTHQRPGWAAVAVDAGLGVIFAAALAVTAIAIAASWGGTSWVFGSVAGAVACAIALVRRRAPLWTAAAGLAVAAAAVLVSWVADLPAEPGPAMTLALAVLVGAAVRQLEPRPAGAVAAGGAAVAAAAWLPGAASTVAMLATTGWLAALATGLYLRLLDTRRQDAAEAVRRDERLQLARELHDVVAHHVTGIVLQAQAAQLLVRKSPQRLNGSLAEIEAAGADALAAMRRLVRLLRDADEATPAARDPEDLRELVQRFSGHGTAVHLRMPDDTVPWPPEVLSTVYRVVQEALTNVTRHAPHAGSVTVDVAQDGDLVTVGVTDDAAHPPARQPSGEGYGLVGMRERVEALGGTFHAGARRGAGWSVVASLPLASGAGT